MPVRFGTIFFDLDGTLVDSIGDIAGALNHTLAAESLPPLPVEDVLPLVGDGVVKLVERAVARQGKSGADVAALVARLLAHYEAHPCEVSKPYAGIPETLAALQQSGRRLAVLTNKPGSVARALLVALGLSDRFVAIVGDHDGYPRKPDPRALDALVARTGGTREGTLMVGDGLPDVAVAKAYGCASAACTWGYVAPERLAREQPTFMLEEPRELLKIV